jgi:hypothetical protein
MSDAWCPFGNMAQGNKRPNQPVRNARYQEIAVVNLNVRVARVAEVLDREMPGKGHFLWLKTRHPSESGLGKSQVHVRIMKVGLQKRDPAFVREQLPHDLERGTEIVIEMMENAIANEVVESSVEVPQGLHEVGYFEAWVQPGSVCLGLKDESLRAIDSQHLHPAFAGKVTSNLAPTTTNLEHTLIFVHIHLAQEKVCSPLGADLRREAARPSLIVATLVLNTPHAM